MPFNRSSKSYLTYLSEHFPAVVITGARQVGKSTLVKEFALQKGCVICLSPMKNPLDAGNMLIPVSEISFYQ